MPAVRKLASCGRRRTGSRRSGERPLSAIPRRVVRPVDFRVSRRCLLLHAFTTVARQRVRPRGRPSRRRPRTARASTRLSTRRVSPLDPCTMHFSFWWSRAFVCVAARPLARPSPTACAGRCWSGRPAPAGRASGAHWTRTATRRVSQIGLGVCPCGVVSIGHGADGLGRARLLTLSSHAFPSHMFCCPIPVLPIAFTVMCESMEAAAAAAEAAATVARPPAEQEADSCAPSHRPAVPVPSPIPPLSRRPFRAPFIPSHPFPVYALLSHPRPSHLFQMCEAIESAAAADEAAATAATPPAEDKAASCVPSHRPTLPNPDFLLSHPRPSHCLYRSVRGHRGGGGGRRGGGDGCDAAR